MKFSTLSILALVLNATKRVSGTNECTYNGAKTGDGFTTDQNTLTIECCGEDSCGNLEGGIVGRISGCHHVICSGRFSCGMHDDDGDYTISIDDGGTLECMSDSCTGGPYFVGAGGSIECRNGSCAYTSFTVGEGTKMTCADFQTCFSADITGHEGASFDLVCTGEESCSHSTVIDNPGGTITCGPSDGACYGFGGSITGPPAVVTCYGEGENICASADISADCLACVGSSEELCGTYVSQYGTSWDACKFNGGPCPTAGAMAGVCPVTNFYLWNSDDNERVAGPYTIADLPTFCLQEWKFSMEADPMTLKPDTDHVEITLSGPITHSRTEQNSPYALFANNGNNFNGREMKVGDYDMRTEVFNDDGQELEDATFYFSFEECDCVVPLTPPN